MTKICSWISNQNDFSIADLHVISILPRKFESIALLVQEKKLKTDLQKGL